MTIQEIIDEMKSALKCNNGDMLELIEKLEQELSKQDDKIRNCDICDFVENQKYNTSQDDTPKNNPMWCLRIEPCQHAKSKEIECMNWLRVGCKHYFNGKIIRKAREL